MRRILSAIACLISFTSSANINADSLVSLWNDDDVADTIRYEVAIQHARLVVQNVDPRVIEIFEEFIEEVKDFENKRWYISAKRYEIALRNNYEDSDPVPEFLALAEEAKLTKDIMLVCYVYSTLAWHYYLKGEISEELKYHLIQVKLLEKGHSNTTFYADLLNRIGIVNFTLDRFDVAENYYQQSLDVAQPIGDKSFLARIHMRLSEVARETGDSSSIRKHSKISLELAEETNDSTLIAMIKIGFIDLLLDEGDFKKAILYCEEAIKAFQKENYQRLLGFTYAQLAKAQFKEGDYKAAKLSAEKGLELAEANKLVLEIINCSDVLFRVHEELGHPQIAIDYYKRHIELKDSLRGTQHSIEITSIMNDYDATKKAYTDSITQMKQKHAAELKHETELQEERNLIYLAITGAGFFLILALILLRGFNRKKRDNELINTAYDSLEEKNNEILDSMAYAKRIQAAILPPDREVNEKLKNSFVLYKPKDIVAGDFYWLEEKNGAILFAAADCTGHGVPGAMVSVICNNALNRSVREYDLSDPGKILDRAREIVIGEFEKSDEEVQDGMDIALCSLNGTSLSYAGAHNPLWLIRDGEIIETKGDKQPIGKFDKASAFITKSMELKPGDTFYIFSDGYVDQFGGEKGKKFKPKALRQLLLSVQDKTMSDQKILINDAFEEWKGEFEQVDDVCMIGVRI